MRKFTLTLVMLVGAISFSVAQSGTGTSTTTKQQAKTEKSVVLTEKKPAKEVKSVKMQNIKATPQKSEEAIIEEKKTNQK